MASMKTTLIDVLARRLAIVRNRTYEDLRVGIALEAEILGIASLCGVRAEVERQIEKEPFYGLNP